MIICMCVYSSLPSVLWRCWLGGRKCIRPVKTEWWGAGMVVCLEQGADLHMAQLMPLPHTVSCFSKIQIGFWYRLTRIVPDKVPLNGCVCACVVACELIVCQLPPLAPLCLWWILYHIRMQYKFVYREFVPTISVVRVEQSVSVIVCMCVQWLLN